MTSVNLQQWIQHPETLNRDTLYELRNQLARYPYFQSLRLLYLKNLYILHDINFGAELRKAVLYIADRRKLFHLIEGERFAVESQKKGLLVLAVFARHIFGRVMKWAAVDSTASGFLTGLRHHQLLQRLQRRVSHEIVRHKRTPL